jgi:DNA-binding beta-propeller fold protein YncE
MMQRIGVLVAAAAMSVAPARSRSIPLPGAPAEGGVAMDYIAYDRAHGRVWVPAGNTGRVDVIDVATGKVTAIEGFATKEVERNGRKRTMGPSSVAIGDGVVYVGSRGDDTICALDAASLAKGPCVELESMPDAVAVVRSAKEIWVTTQANDSIVVLDTASPGALRVKTTFALAGVPECLLADDGRGIVYTNLEDKDRTVAVDVKTRQVTKTWQPGCGEEGPRGLALDAKLDFLFVACTTRVQLLDAGHDGKLLGAIDVGAGVDSIDYVAGRHELFAAARVGKLVIARLGPRGTLTPVATVDTAAGARNAVATEKGVAYLTSGREGAVVVVER